MAGIGDLRGRVIIDDGASGTLTKIQGGLNRIAQLQSNVARSFSSIGAGAAAGQLTAFLDKAAQFNKHSFGVGVAALADNTKEVTDAATGVTRMVYDYAKVRSIMAEVEKTSLGLSKELGVVPTRVIGIAEVLAKAGMESEKLAAATKATVQASLTDDQTTPQKLGEFASVLDSIYKPRPGEEWAQFFKRQMNIIMTAADETRLSLGSTMEGMRAFSALYAQMGNSETTNASLLMGGVKMGGEATEIGHTLKSDAVRMLKMTQGGARTFSMLGLDRRNYTDVAAMDPNRTVGNLMSMFPNARPKGKEAAGFRARLTAEIAAAQADGSFTTEEFQNRLMDRFAKLGGIDVSDELSRKKFEEKFINAIFGSGLRFDMGRLFDDLIKAGVTPTQLASIFEGRRIGSNTQILGGRKQYGAEYDAKLKRADGSGLDAVSEIYQGSAAGRLGAYKAMIENFEIRLANSKGFENFLNAITAVFDKLGQVPQPLLDLATSLTILGIALGPAAAAIAVAIGSAKLIGGATAAAAGASGIGSVLARFGIIPSSASVIGPMGLGGAAATGAGAVAGGKAAASLGARWLPGIGWVVAGGLGAYDAYNAWQSGAGVWDTTKAFIGGATGWSTVKSFFGGSPAHAAEAPPSAAAPSTAGFPGTTGGVPMPSGEPATGGVAQAEAEAQSTVDRIRQIFASADFAAEGRQAMATFAAGMRDGLAEVEAVAERAKSIARNALTGAAPGGVRLNTGPSMRGAN